MLVAAEIWCIYTSGMTYIRLAGTIHPTALCNLWNYDNPLYQACSIRTTHITRLWLQLDSTVIPSPFDAHSTAIRPRDDSRSTCVGGGAAALRPKQAVGGRPPRYAPPPVRDARCGPAPAHSRLTPGLRRPARFASGSCGRHE